MAKDLKAVIRLHEWEVDEKRRKLGELLRLSESLEDQAQRLEEELVREQQTAKESPEEAGLLYGNYAEAVIDRRRRIAESITKTEEEIDDSREILREAYLELKKFEVAQENRDKRAALELARKDQAFLDEVGSQSFRSR